MVILKGCPKCGEVINFIDCYDKLDTTVDTSGGTYEEFYVLDCPCCGATITAETTYELKHIHTKILSVETEEDK